MYLLKDNWFEWKLFDIVAAKNKKQKQKKKTQKKTGPSSFKIEDAFMQKTIRYMKYKLFNCLFITQIITVTCKCNIFNNRR